MLKTKEKEKITEKHKLHKQDTGSSEVQIALLSEEIKKMLSHLKKHPKDLHSRKGLLGMVSKRRKFLKYLKAKSPKKYLGITNKLGLKTK